MGVRLPAEYQEVEYLHGNGEPWINTGVVGTEEISYDLSFMSTTQARQGVVFGSRTGATSNNIATVCPAMIDNLTRYVVCDFGDYTKTRVQYYVNPIKDVRIYAYNSKTKRLIKNCNTQDTITDERVFSGTIKTPSNLHIFHKTNGFAATQYNFIGRLYYCNIWKNGLSVRKFVPCYRKSDFKPGMYDLVTGEFFTNQGTGEFEVGPDVIDSISPLMVAWRRMLMQNVPIWDYVLTSKDSYGGLYQRAIPVTAGQTIVIAWQNRQSKLTRRLWGLEDGASLVGITATNIPANQIPLSGQYTYTVETDGTFIAAGLQTGGGQSSYYLQADWVKVRITG